MNIAIIGAGNVGGTVGIRWARGGHRVIFGVRDPGSEKVRKLLGEAGENASAASTADAVAEASVVVLATPWDATREALAAAGNLDGKIILDCTNPLNPNLQGLALGTTTSGAEQVASWAPGAKVVKGLNTTGSDNMKDPQYGPHRVSMFIAGDDIEAKNSVSGLIESLGFEVIDMGDLFAARYLEPLAMAWIHLAFARGYGRDFAFKIIRR